ncbi:MAG TPA: hypothetical protein VNA04_00780 [Thermoanaerobaculia bacterium]|nr:hypothetical protein [Thermoanaerobaculia bacterium]
MKHGDKKKGKASKASRKKGSPARKAGKAVSGAKAKIKTKSSRKAGPKVSKSKGGNGIPRSRGSTDVTFTNPVIGSAFKHALRKYPNALRKLTD